MSAVDPGVAGGFADPGVPVIAADAKAAMVRYTFGERVMHWWVGLTFVALMILGGGMTGPFLVMLSPFFIVAGMSLITPAHAAVRYEPQCPTCRAILPAETARDHAPTQEGFRSPTFAR